MTARVQCWYEATASCGDVYGGYITADVFLEYDAHYDCLAMKAKLIECDCETASDARELSDLFDAQVASDALHFFERAATHPNNYYQLGDADRAALVSLVDEVIRSGEPDTEVSDVGTQPQKARTDSDWRARVA